MKKTLSLIMFLIILISVIYPVGILDSNISAEEMDITDSAAVPVLTSVKHVDYKYIKLTWDVKETDDYNIIAFDIYRKEANTDWSKYKTVAGIDTRTYTDKNVKFNTKYYYKICTRGLEVLSDQWEEVKFSDFSKTKSYTLKIADNKSFNLEPRYCRADLYWDKVNGATGYKIYYSTSENGKYTLAKTITGASTTTYKKTGLKNKKTYFFKIRAYKKVSSSYTYYTKYTAPLKCKTISKTISDLRDAIRISEVKITSLSNGSGMNMRWRNNSSKTIRYIKMYVYGYNGSQRYKKRYCYVHGDVPPSTYKRGNLYFKESGKWMFVSPQGALHNTNGKFVRNLNSYEKIKTYEYTKWSAIWPDKYIDRIQFDKFIFYYTDGTSRTYSASVTKYAFY